MQTRRHVAWFIVLCGLVLAIGGVNVIAGQLVDLNTATAEELKALPGMTEGLVLMIEGGRPYQTADELVSRQILTKEQFDKIKGQVTAVPPKKAKPQPTP